MKFKLEKKLKILNELITCFYKLGNANVDVKLTTINNETNFFISSEIENLKKSDIDELIDILNTPRQHEIEEYYWQLGGESELDCELTLISMMIDSAKITYENNILSIHAIRK